MYSTAARRSRMRCRAARTTRPSLPRKVNTASPPMRSIWPRASFSSRVCRNALGVRANELELERRRARVDDEHVHAGTRPSRIIASFAASMFPPDTTHTTLPADRDGEARPRARPPRRPRRRLARARPAGAPRPQSAATLETSAPLEQRAHERPHLRQHAHAADAVDEAGLSLDARRCAGCQCGGERWRRLDLACVHGARSAAAARTAVAMPLLNPPPPNGTSTASTSGRSSTISRPIVPLPAIDRGVRHRMDEHPIEARIRVLDERLPPSLVRHAYHASPPSRSMASSFVRGALSGTTTLHGTPSRRALQATPCAMLPALAVYTPRASALGARRAASRCRAAKLERADGLQVLELEPDLAGCVGDVEPNERRANAMPASRSRAARMSATVTSSGVGIAQTAELDPRSRAGRDRAVVDAARRRRRPRSRGRAT